MLDISTKLKEVNKDECSVLRALLLLLDTTIKEEENKDVHILQSKPEQQVSR